MRDPEASICTVLAGHQWKSATRVDGPDRQGSPDPLRQPDEGQPPSEIHAPTNRADLTVETPGSGKCGEPGIGDLEILVACA